MAQFIDWKALLEGFDEALPQEKERIRVMLIDMPKRLLEQLFEKELYARLLYEKAVGHWTPPVEWTKELERKLKDVFEASFTRAGVSPRRFMAEYRLELATIKLLETEEDMIKAVNSYHEIMPRYYLTDEEVKAIYDYIHKKNELYLSKFTENNSTE